MFDTILYEIESGRARITLNRPTKLNAMSLKMQAELSEALWDADARKDVHCAIIKGAGRAFTAGYDLAGGDSVPVSRMQAETLTHRIAGIEASTMISGNWSAPSATV